MHCSVLFKTYSEFDVDVSALANGNIVDRYSFKLDPQAGATLLLL